MRNRHENGRRGRLPQTLRPPAYQEVLVSVDNLPGLFGRTWTQADAWSFARCEGAQGRRSPSGNDRGEELLMSARGKGGGAPMNSVQFPASA